MKKLGTPNYSKTEKVLVVGLRRPKMTKEYSETSLDELASLVDTAGGEVVSRIFQDLKSPNPATLIGSGKVSEIAEELAGSDISTVVIDDELTPAQNRNLNEMFGVKVLDRTALILDIFAKRAHTKEGKLQVEMAQMQYLLPHLSGKGLSLSQQAGYIGNRGPGETKLEVDRRRVRERIARLKKELSSVRRHREIHRRKREGVPIPTVSLIGYTNAGKSTLLNRLTGAGVFVEDKLFATLDPTVRKLRLGSGREILMADTVGFIKRLPHQLVDAFKATFEEVERSDLLIHVVDVSAPDAPGQMKTVMRVLSELGLAGKGMVTVLNKCDIPRRNVQVTTKMVEISAIKGSGIDRLLEEIDRFLLEKLKIVHLKVPYSSSGVLDDLYRHGHIFNVQRLPEYMIVEVSLGEKLMGKYGNLMTD